MRFDPNSQTSASGENSGRTSGQTSVAGQDSGPGQPVGAQPLLELVEERAALLVAIEAPGGAARVEHRLAGREVGGLPHDVAGEVQVVEVEPAGVIGDETKVVVNKLFMNKLVARGERVQQDAAQWMKDVQARFR